MNQEEFKANEKSFFSRINPHNNYLRTLEVRTAAIENPEDEGKMIIEGKAICYEDETVLFEFQGIQYKEIIKAGAFDGADIHYCFLKYNHSDNIMAMARVKNGTLQIFNRDDGVYFKADLANTTAGRDLYELVKRGDIDKMSFAFTIKDESYDEVEHRWTVNKIEKVYDFAAVTVPAYDNTDLYSRRFGDAEARKSEVEALNREKEKNEEQRQLALKSLNLKIKLFNQGGKSWKD